MRGMRRFILVLPAAALVLAGCSPSANADKQWYKPNVDYTAADFERDRATCTDTKKKVLDEDCMKQRGWVALGADIGSPVKPPDPTKSPSGPKGKY
jgi:PBP1b-binding outer membrane lipoprotein LpoB